MWLDSYQIFTDTSLGHKKKHWLDFSDFDLLFKNTVIETLKFQASALACDFLVCTVSCEPMVGPLPKFRGYIIGT